MRVALVHDDLVQWGGAERVLVALSELFPGAPIYTSVYDEDNELISSQFTSKKIVTSFLQTVPGWKSMYKALLPFYGVAFEQFNFDEYDLVVSQTTRFAKAIITKPGTVHVCYCHTPIRFLWGISPVTDKTLSIYLSFLRVYDRVASKRVDYWIAGSENAKRRINQYYQAEAKIVYPFVDLNRFKDLRVFDGGYYLVIARLNKYKNVDLIIKMASSLKLNLKIVGDGPERSYLESISGSTIDFLGNLSEDYLNQVLAGCKALIVAAEEDFGLASLEAQALCKPVIAYKRGGNLETVVEGMTGYFFEQLTEDSLIAALGKLEKHGYNIDSCLANARRFSKEEFIKRFNQVIEQFCHLN